MLSSLKNKVCDLIRVKLYYVTKNGKFLNKKLFFTRIFFKITRILWLVIIILRSHKEEICSN